MKIYSAKCDPDCGFIVKDHDKDEAVKFVQEHAENTHDMEVSRTEAEKEIEEEEM